jgi:hypothetical protein
MEARRSERYLHWLYIKLGEFPAVVPYFTGPSAFQALQEKGISYHYKKGKSKIPAKVLDSLMVFSYVDGLTA